MHACEELTAKVTLVATCCAVQRGNTSVPTLTKGPSHGLVVSVESLEPLQSWKTIFLRVFEASAITPPPRARADVLI